MDKARDYLATASLYQLGELNTEQPHPKTVRLSEWAQKDLPRAVQALAEVDQDALAQLGLYAQDILNLREDIQKTFASGRRVFLIGCGATGRLSLTLENLYREQHANAKGDMQNQVVSLMAGGDVALVHSLEGFEDFPNYAARHLQDLQFSDGDLLIAITEGGETPYVIGGVEFAAKTSRSPYFLYCNPDNILCRLVERSKRVLENPRIKKINLSVGPMAITGSTRMQASTVLQLAVGLALLTTFNAKETQQFLQTLANIYVQNVQEFLPGFIERESREYLENRYVIYRAFDYAITIFTDTTERAPTFSLSPFSHPQATRLLKLKPSLAYVQIPQAKNSQQAWEKLLQRKPHALNWLDIDDRTSSSYLAAFDFGPGAEKFRAGLTQNTEHNFFEIEKKNDFIEWRFLDCTRQLIFPTHGNVNRLFEHTLLKMLLNAHSTLVMGRLGRYENNIMTYVFPTNGKLIDRATRYVRILLERKGVVISYEEAVIELFKQHAIIKSGESVVLNTVQSFISRIR